MTAPTGPPCAACARPLDLALTRAGHGLHPACPPLTTPPAQVVDEALGLVAAAITSAPRTVQTRVGPSELGTPCARRLGYRLAGTPPARPPGPAWIPATGTAVHEWLATVMARAEHDATAAGAPPRWHVEQRLAVGAYGPDQVTVDGSCDLYDAWTGTVIDWKNTSRNQIRERYRPHGPGPQYTAQAHLYARGWALRGLPVAHVAVVWLPRDGELGDAHTWTAPYDETVALAALDRAGHVATLLAALGPAAALRALPTADAHCRWCPWHAPGSPDPAAGCAGHPGRAGPPAPAPRGLAAALHPTR